MTRIAPSLAALAVAALILAGCSASAPEPDSDPPVVEQSAAPLTPEEQFAATVSESCDLPPQEGTPGQPPEVLCLFPDEEFFMFCARAMQRVPLAFTWATAGGERAWLALGRVDDAEATAFAGPLDGNGQYSGDPAGELRFDCGAPFTDYTFTVEGEGGRTSVQFSLFRRIP